jgi:uncharacterized membrane protein HdeD (DUF308 family)
MRELTRSTQATEGHVRWKWFLALGVLLVLLGLAAAGATTLLELASLLVFGPLLLASSIVQFFTAFLAGPEPVPKHEAQVATPFTGKEGLPPAAGTRRKSRSLLTKESLFHYIDAGLEAALGFFIMVDPVVAITDLAVLVAIFLVVRGLVRLIRSWNIQSPDRGWIIMAGLAALLLGVCVWLPLPVSKLWLAGLCLAVDFICHGVVWSAIALARQKPLEALPS